MREFSTPVGTPFPATGNLTDALVANAREAPDRVALLRRPSTSAAPSAPPRTRQGGSRPDPGWEEVTAAQFLAEVAILAKGLLAAGIDAGDRVALLARTSYEWTLVDYAIWFAGAVSVPVYESSSTEQVAWILGDSGSRAVIVDGARHLDRVAQVRGDLDALAHVWSLADGALKMLKRLGGEVSDRTLDERRRAATPLDLATVLYTSGTTGRPKGCMLTHGCFQAEIAGAIRELPELFDGEDATTLLFLPLAHVFARIIEVGAVTARVRLAHSARIASLTDDLAAVRPTFVLAVPRVFEKLFNTASQQAAADGRGGVFDRATEAAIAWSRALEAGRVPLRVRARHAAYGRLVHQRIRASLGGACRYAVSGGAPLGERLGHFYRGIGLTVLEGYGLTETTGAVTVNSPETLKIGTVGRPLPGVSVRVSEDGELLFRGGQVFAGYWQDEPATRDVLDRHGWLHTGDLGEVDDEGFVRVTGRRKEILVTAGGKNVSPTMLEDRARAHPLVGQCLVVGDRQPFIAALVTLDHEALAQWAGTLGKSRRLDDLVSDPDLDEEVASAIEEANKAVSKAEAIRKFTILPVEWTEESGHLTPSLKLKRGVVSREFREEIAALYAR